VACLFKTRAEAQRACRAGQVEVAGRAAKPHRALHVGDEIRITRGSTGKQVVVVKGLAEVHIPKARARTLYEDRTPPPAPEVLEVRRLERLWRQSQPHPVTVPDKRDRRALRRLKGRD
jgi:ribosome-associated heat shock protein Hsp15